jgi:hypothetical protein
VTLANLPAVALSNQKPRAFARGFFFLWQHCVAVWLFVHVHQGGSLMRYNLATFKQDVRIGAGRAFHDLFSPVAALYRLLVKIGNQAAERNIREAQQEHVLQKGRPIP